ncbi:hypothetical protein SUGI_0274630 [Cryptomeria japonica]|nr:hypothetical protein SUGI_0274630 [Cryptomeria japonica]
MSRTMRSLNSLLGGGVEEEEEEESDGRCGLSYQERIYGFAACLAGGLLCTLLSLLLIFRPIKFAVTFTFGNLLSLASTAFLVGPMRQVNMMFDPARIVASIIFIGSIVIALVCALYIHNRLLTLLAIIIEFCALIW